MNVGGIVSTRDSHWQVITYCEQSEDDVCHQNCLQTKSCVQKLPAQIIKLIDEENIEIIIGFLNKFINWANKNWFKSTFVSFEKFLSTVVTIMVQTAWGPNCCCFFQYTLLNLRKMWRRTHNRPIRLKNRHGYAWALSVINDCRSALWYQQEV